MAVGVAAFGSLRPRAHLGSSGSLMWLARLLAIAVVLDLVVTRFVVRLAIFVPKGEPWATVSGVLGRIGAAIDAAVPLVGLVLLGALLVDAGRGRRAGEALTLSAVAAVAAAGFAALVAPPRVEVALTVDVLIVIVAGVVAPWVCRGPGPIVARIGVVGLAAGTGLAAVAEIFGLVGAAMPGDSPSLALAALGQLAFVAGALFVGIGGFVGSGAGGPGRARFAALGLAVAVVVLAIAWRTPAMWGILSIWSVGLTGAVPAPIVALAIGCASAGLPLLYRRSAGLALGAAIVLLAGYDLAASGLLLAGLLGLALAGSLDRGRAAEAGRQFTP